ncbi:hypothetical protein BGW80DRAFT_1460540 [Lactifluus volemus]|nr:hypothetical protein BGW80DRAFT_1460540 [Lactifluus volemus]
MRQRLRAILSRSERSSPPMLPSSDPSSADADADDDPSAPSPAPPRMNTQSSSELAKGSVDELTPLRDFRVRILPVLGPLPALSVGTSRPMWCKLYERMWKDVFRRESRIAGKQIKYACLSPPFWGSCPSANQALSYDSLPLTTDDIALLYDDFALGRSIVPPQVAFVRPALVRWDPRAPFSLESCIVGEMNEGYVGALEELIDPARVDNGRVIWCGTSRLLVSTVVSWVGI